MIHVNIYIVDPLMIDIKIRYWIIIYVCIPRFHFCSKYLLFTPNPSHYTPKYLCYYPKGLILFPISSSGYVPISLSCSYVEGDEGCCAHKVHCAKLGGGGVQMGEFAQVCTILFQCEKFIAPIPITNMTLMISPRSARYLGHQPHG